MDAPRPSDGALSPQVEAFLEEPERFGDVVDFLILVGIALALVVSLGAALFFVDAVWDVVGLGEGAPPQHP